MAWREIFLKKLYNCSISFLPDTYSYIFDRLTDDLIEKSDYSRFCKNNLSFITFNYDRSLEHFLYESLVNSFNNIPPEKIKEQISKLRIIHIFGQIAGLEWQDLDSKIEYSGNIKDIDELVNNLRIIYEEKENPELEEAQQLVSEAQNIFFLGFGYAKENLDILNIPEILTMYSSGLLRILLSEKFLLIKM